MHFSTCEPTTSKPPPCKPLPNSSPYSVLLKRYFYFFFIFFYFIHTSGKPRSYGIINENPATAQKYEKQKKSPTRSRSNYKHSLPPEYRNIKKLTNRDIYKSS